MTDTVTITKEDLLQIMLHLSKFSPDATTTKTRDRLLEASKNLTPNNELYVIGQKAVSEAATAKRELAAAEIEKQERANEIVTLLAHVDVLNRGEYDDELRESVEKIRKLSKRFAFSRVIR